MTTAYTSLLGLALPVTGELSGTWGDTVNTAITSLLDTAIAGTTSITTDADITLSTTTGASNQARQAIILWNPASGTTTRNITAPAQSKMYVVINASGGTQSIVIRGVGPTTGVTIAKGESATVAWNGSDFVKVSSSGGAITFTDLTVTGNTILGDAAADTLTVNATSTFASPVSFQNLVRLPSTGRSAAAALTVTAPAFLYGVASTYTDTTSSGTIAAMAPFYSIAQPTLSTSNVTTYTNATTLYIANAPAAGGSATITNPYSLYIAAGNAYFADNVTLGSSTADSVAINGTVVSNLIFTDNTYDIGASGATRPRSLFLGSNLTVGGNATLGDAAADTLTVNSTITSNLIFTDNTYDIGASGATRPRNLYLAGNAVIAGSTTFSGGTANGIAYLNGSKVLTAGSLLNFNGSNIGFDTTPSSWPSGRPTIEFGGATQAAIAFNGNVTNGGAIWTNSYYDGSQPIYKANGFASIFSTDNGGFSFNNSVAGLAGNVVTIINRFRVGQTESVFNEDSYDYDFRVESDSSTHALFVDASTNRVGMFYAVPDSVLAIDIGSSVTGDIHVKDSASEMSFSGSAYGFNRKVSNGNIYNSNYYAYQWNKTNSSTAANDYLALQVYSPAGAGVNTDAIRVNGTGSVAINPVGFTADFSVATPGVPYAIYARASTNRVGIGTNDPQQFFHVKGTHTTGAAVTAIFGSSNATNSGLDGGVAISPDPTTKLGNIASTGSDSGLAFYTNQGGSDILRAKIDYLGRFTLSSQPCFTAARSGDQTGYDAASTGDVVIIYNSAVQNVGSHYNTTTGKFTAPTAGLYIFSHSALTTTGGVTFSQAWLIVNGGRGSYTDTLNANKDTASGTIQIYLSAGDTVGVHYYSAGSTSITISQNVYHTYFKGYLVS